MTDNENDVVEGLRLAGDSLFNNAADLIESLSADLERVTKERDAAVEDLKEFNSCYHCIYYKTAECNDKCYFIIGNKPDWQWRGVKE